MLRYNWEILSILAPLVEKNCIKNKASKLGEILAISNPKRQTKQQNVLFRQELTKTEQEAKKTMWATKGQGNY